MRRRHRSMTPHPVGRGHFYFPMPSRTAKPLDIRTYALSTHATEHPNDPGICARTRFLVALQRRAQPPVPEALIPLRLHLERRLLALQPARRPRLHAAACCCWQAPLDIPQPTGPCLLWPSIEPEDAAGCCWVAHRTSQSRSACTKPPKSAPECPCPGPPWVLLLLACLKPPVRAPPGIGRRRPRRRSPARSRGCAADTAGSCAWW